MATHLLQPDAVVLDHAIAVGAQIEVIDGRIRSIGFHRDPGGERVAGTLLPGFVDLQVNGAGGCGVDEATPDALEHIAEVVATHGAVAFLPTLITAPLKQLLEQVNAVAHWIEDRRSGGSHPLGIHVEGPFLETPGAHDPSALIDPTTERVAQMIEAGRGHIKLVTLAPSRSGAPAAVEQFCRAGITVALGHDGDTGRSSEQIAESVTACTAAGATMATHLFNAMGPRDHRDPGLAGRIMDTPQLSCGMILDDVHVHEITARQAFACIGVERFVLVTDCVSAMGMADGDYTLANTPVTLCAGEVRKTDGTLAGSALTMHRAAVNFLRAVPAASAWTVARVAATNPAQLIHAEDFGRITPGRFARFTQLGEDGTFETVVPA